MTLWPRYRVRFQKSGNTFNVPRNVQAEFLFFAVIQKVTGLDRAQAGAKLEADGKIVSSEYVFLEGGGR